MRLNKRAGETLARIRLVKLVQILDGNLTETERISLKRIKNRPVKYLIKPSLWIELLDLLCDVIIRLNELVQESYNQEFLDEQDSFEDSVTEEAMSVI